MMSSCNLQADSEQPLVWTPRQSEGNDNIEDKSSHEAYPKRRSARCFVLQTALFTCAISL